MNYEVCFLPVCLMSSIHPLGVHGIKQSPTSPRASFPAFMLVKLKKKHENNDFKTFFSQWFVMHFWWNKKQQIQHFVEMQIKAGITIYFFNFFLPYPSTSFLGATALITLSVLIVWMESRGSCTMSPWTLEFSLISWTLDIIFKVHKKAVKWKTKR